MLRFLSMCTLILQQAQEQLDARTDRILEKRRAVLARASAP